MKTGIVMGAPLEKFDEATKHIKRIGYDCIDLQQYINPESAFYSFPDSVIVSLKDIVTNNGLVVSQLHGPWSCPPPNNTEEECNFWMDKARKAIHACSLFECKYMVLHPLMPKCYFDLCDSEKVLKINYDFFYRLLVYAEQQNVVVCLENMPFKSLLLSCPEEILDFVKKFESPYFKICLDTGHCNVHGISPAEAIRKLGKEYVSVLHIHDNNGDADSHLNPFDGSIDWKDFSKALYDISFDGVASLETDDKLNRSEIPGNVALAKEIVLFQSVKAIADRLFD